LTPDPTPLADIAPLLRCPNCGASPALRERVVVCPNGHSFDVARQGYVTLMPPRGRHASGDTSAMVAARGRFLGAGHYAPIAAGVAEAAVATPRTVVDLGAGTGYYLAAVLDSRPRARGIALDASRPALRQSARAHPRAAAVGCDIWRELPVKDGAADLVVDVFSPRNGAEIARVLAPDGALVLVKPTARHLHELVERLGLVSVDADKEARVDAALSPELSRTDRTELEFAMNLTGDDVRALVGMGPSARHVEAAAIVAPGATVTASVTIETFRPRQAASAGSRAASRA
jgi:23S rRNA (guanine745-N1)-methyltransferase